jgi:hypothetical protein
MVSGGAYPSGWLSCHAWLYGAGAFVDGAAGSAFVKGGGNGGGWKLGGVDDFFPQPHKRVAATSPHTAMIQHIVFIVACISPYTKTKPLEQVI